MYKNVSNQHIVGIILLFSSCLLTVTAKAQSTNENLTVNYANADLKSDKKPAWPLPQPLTTAKSSGTDTAWKPIRRLWGYTFGDFYYEAHADAGNRGPETNYNGVPTYRNAFQFRRIYLGYEYDINKKFTAEMLLASEPSANTAVSGTTTISNSDNLADNKMAFYIKNFDLRWHGVWRGTDFVIGEMLTPGFPMLTEKIWAYRAIERTISDFHRTNAYDIGASLQGVFDPSTKNFGYNILIANNSNGSSAGLGSAASANTGFYKAFYGDIYAKFLDQTLIFDLYADYMKTAPATASVGGQYRSMLKGFAAYTIPKITFGV